MSDQSGNAFPFVSHGGLHEHQIIEYGLSKRELFVAMICAGTEWPEWGTLDSRAGRFKTHAECAVIMADLLIAALSEPRRDGEGGERGE